MKMVTSVMALNIAVCRNTTFTMTLIICLTTINKTIEIKYTHGYLNQPMVQKFLWLVTIIFISQIMGDIGRLFRAKGR